MARAIHLGGLLVGLWLAVDGAEPIAWLGAAAVLFCGLRLCWRRGEAPLPSWASRILSPTLVVLLVLWVTWDLVVGGAPLSRDHPVHLYKTWILVHDLLPTGRLWGWSDRWYAGFPVNEGYPLLPYLWGAGAHLATFGLVDLERSYGLGQVALWSLLALTTYLWGHRLGGPIAGVAAAIFVVLDPGAFRGGGREGGWTYHAQLGVWPQALAIAFAMLSGLVTAEALRRRAGGRWIAGAGVLGAAALLSHPLGLVPLAGIHVALVLGRVLSHRSAPRGWTPLLGAGGAMVLAVLLSSFWLALFLGNRGTFRSSPGAWRDLDDLAAGLLRGELFLDMWAVPGVLAVAGALLLLRRRSAEDLAVVGLALVSIVFVSPHAVGTLFGADLPGPLVALQYDRLAIHAKPFLFAMAGVAVAALARASAPPVEGDQGQPARREGLRARAATAVICLLVSPLALWMGRQAGTFLPEVGQIPTTETSPERAAMEELARWISDHAAREPGPVRVALRHEPTMPRVVEELFVVAARAGVSIHHLSGTPADTFRHRSHHSSAEELRALNVRWVVSRGDYAQSHLRLVTTIGPWQVQEHVGYSPARATVEGPGTVEVLEDSAERLRLRLEGASPETRVVVHRSPHPRWGATVDGAPVTVVDHRRRGGATFMALTGLSDGEVVLAYGRLPLDLPGLALSLLGILLVVVLVVRRPAEGTERSPSTARSVPRWARSAAVVGAVAGGLVAAALLAAQGAPSTSGARDLVTEISRARFVSRPSPPCRTLGLCHLTVPPPAVVLRGYHGAVGPCIRLAAPTSGRYRLAFPAHPGGRRTTGAWYWTEGPRASREVRPQPLATAPPSAWISANGMTHPLPRAPRGRWRAFDFRGEPGDGQIALELESSCPGRVDACFRVTAR